MQYASITSHCEGTMDRIERKILDILDANAENFIRDGEALFGGAERGFAEFETARMTAAKLRERGLAVRENLAVTGVKAVIGKGEGPTVAVIGELNGIMCAEHPLAVADTGMSHACGHNAQMIGIFGAALALSDPEVAASLDGKVAFSPCPRRNTCQPTCASP